MNFEGNDMRKWQDEDDAPPARAGFGAGVKWALGVLLVVAVAGGAVLALRGNAQGEAIRKRTDESRRKEESDKKWQQLREEQERELRP